MDLTIEETKDQVVAGDKNGDGKITEADLLYVADLKHTKVPHNLYTVTKVS